jgi:two-component system catabolic regulation response regulator CreB
MKPKILIVEDEPTIIDSIRYALETDGFDVHCLFSGMPVMPLLSREKIDLIVLDIGLPDISGLELCKEIRKIHPVPIIFLTARSEEVDRVVGLEIGADDYVIKPFSPRELSARITAVLRRVSGSTSENTPFGAFRIDESKCRISYFEKPLNLSRYEYEILKTFIKRPGQVYSRDHLMSLVWDEPEASMDRTVDAHIKNIRAKLKSIHGDVDPIRTHRGMGYSLKEGI